MWITHILTNKHTVRCLLICCVICWKRYRIKLLQYLYVYFISLSYSSCFRFGRIFIWVNFRKFLWFPVSKRSFKIWVYLVYWFIGLLVYLFFLCLYHLLQRIKPRAVRRIKGIKITLQTNLSLAYFWL